MEDFKSPEQHEPEIETLISDFELNEEMQPGEITDWLIASIPGEGSDAPPEFIEEMAQRIGTSPEELLAYAVKKAEELDH